MSCLSSGLNVTVQPYLCGLFVRSWSRISTVGLAWLGGFVAFCVCEGEGSFCNVGVLFRDCFVP